MKKAALAPCAEARSDFRYKGSSRVFVGAKENYALQSWHHPLTLISPATNLHSFDETNKLQLARF